ncbi:phage portal protein, lambda family [Hartmannibacter diazotrophicus]|uniref:Phage portal protein, lambda family n=1 Tax=Hartmannibacter diazotrophicus TaxID=1482074 RepID=A0A2C9D252_9HYPH|nr:phage portal protein [Hartmannibacter diazotrophicus]SON54326.1 phage portal protein, lambda family [Hartmannibacter diazotrophicus]
MKNPQRYADVLGPSSDDLGTLAPSGVRVPGGASKEMAIVGDAYEGASRKSRELAMWNPPSRSADQDILPQKRLADARVRDTINNDAYVRSGQTIHKDHIVGGKYILNAKPVSQIVFGKDDEVWEEEFQTEVETKFGLWANSRAHWVDGGRRNTFTQLIRQAVGTYFATGEVLAAVEWIRDDAEIRPFNTAIRMLDLDRLSNPALGGSNPFIVGGVEVNKRHVPVAYHVRKAPPGAYWLASQYEWERIPAKKPWGRPQVIHLYEQTRPNQTRGMAPLVAALKEMRMTKDFRDIVLQNAVVNATYAASIESDLDTSVIFQRLGGGNVGNGDLSQQIDESVTSYMAAYLGAVDSYIGASDQFQLGGVRIPHLPPGSKLHMQPAAKGGPLGTDLEKSLLRHIAACLNVSYEQLSRDYSETNYSSAQAAMGETWKHMLACKGLLADAFASIVYRLWLEEAINSGMIESLPRRLGNDSAWLYKPLVMEAITECEWIGAALGQIDQLKETQAASLRMKFNMTTLESEVARLGGDWRQVLKQRARERNRAEELGLRDAADTQDNSVNAASGSVSAAAGENNDNAA